MKIIITEQQVSVLKPKINIPVPDDYLRSFTNRPQLNVKYPVQTNTKQSGNTKKTFDVIFMGGKEESIPFDIQLKFMRCSLAQVQRFCDQ